MFKRIRGFGVQPANVMRTVLQLTVVPSPERPVTDRSDDELMLLASASHFGPQSKDAFEVLVRRYLPKLTQFCAKFVANPRIGEELAQEVMLQAWATRRRYRPDGRFAVFLFTLARNRCKNFVRDQGRRQRRGAGAELDDQALETPSTDSSSLDLLIEQESQRRVREAMERLPAKLKEALLLRYDQDLDYSDIARIVRRPEATARSRVFHGLKKLRLLLAAGVEA
ncbi:MAG: RNA polymerase sigma factor [Myxococcaceae bacterium]